MKKLLTILLVLFLLPLATAVDLPLNQTEIEQSLDIQQTPPQIQTAQIQEQKEYVVRITNIEKVQNVSDPSRAQLQLQDILRDHFQDTKRVNNNIFTAQLTPQQKEHFENTLYIESIEPNIEIKTALPNNKKVVGAHKTHQVNIQNQTLHGQNQATCIIDTGIDYTHEDFGSCELQKLENKTQTLEPYNETPYTPGTTETWTVKNEEWPTIQLHFEYIDIETNEELRIKKDGEIQQIFSGQEQNAWTDVIDTNKVTIELQTSSDTSESHTNQGFKLSSIREAEKGLVNCPQVAGGRDITQQNIYDYKDTDGHGTHVAGIIAANGTNKGVAPNSKIYAVNAFQSGSSSFSDLIKSIEHCTAVSDHHNISSISMSLGSVDTYSPPCFSSTFQDAVDKANAKNISVIAATGNQGVTGKESFPACLPNIYSVAATTTQDTLASFSNIASSTTISAPGQNIESTSLGSGSTTKSGTSMATPFVTGLALLQTQFKQLTGTTGNPVEALAQRSPTLTLNGLETPRAHIGDTIIDALGGTINTPSLIGKQNFTIQYNQKYPSVQANIKTQKQAFTPGNPYTLETNADLLGLQQGNNTVNITYNAANSTKTQQFTIQHDGKTPRITEITPPNNTKQPGKTVNVTIKTDTSNTTILYNGTTNNTVPTNKTIPVTIKDQANNTDTTTIFYPKDPDPLKITLNAPQYTNTYTPKTTFQANNATKCTQKINNNKYNKTQPRPTHTNKGENTYKVTCHRPGYNVTTQQTITIDPETPITSIKTPTLTPNQTVKLTTQNNTPTTTYYSINNTAIEEYQDNITLPPGTHTLTYYSENKAGSTEPSKTRTVRIVSPPNISFNNTKPVPTNTTYTPKPTITSLTPTNTTITIQNQTKPLGESFTLPKNKTYNVTIHSTNTFNQTQTHNTTINTTTKPLLELNNPVKNQYSPFKPLTIKTIADETSLNITCGSSTTHDTTTTITCQEPTLNIQANLTRNQQQLTKNITLAKNNTLPTLTTPSNQTLSTNTPLNISTNADNLTITLKGQTDTIKPSTKYYADIQPGTQTTTNITITATNKIGNKTKTKEVTLNETPNITEPTQGNATQGNAKYTPPKNNSLSTHIPLITGLNTTNISLKINPPKTARSLITYTAKTNTTRESRQTIRIEKNNVDRNANNPTNITFYNNEDTPLNTTYTGETERNSKTYYEYTVLTQNYSTFYAEPNITESNEETSDSGIGSGGSGGGSGGGPGATSGSGGGGLGPEPSTESQEENTAIQLEDTQTETTSQLSINTTQTTWTNPVVTITNPANNTVQIELQLHGDITRILTPQTTQLTIPPNTTKTKNYTTHIFQGTAQGTIETNYTDPKNITIHQHNPANLDINTPFLTTTRLPATITLRTDTPHRETVELTLAKEQTIITTQKELRNNEPITVQLHEKLPSEYIQPITIPQYLLGLERNIQPGTYEITLQTRNLQTTQEVTVYEPFSTSNKMLLTIFLIKVSIITLLLLIQHRKH